MSQTNGMPIAAPQLAKNPSQISQTPPQTPMNKNTVDYIALDIRDNLSVIGGATTGSNNTKQNINPNINNNNNYLTNQQQQQQQIKKRVTFFGDDDVEDDENRSITKHSVQQKPTRRMGGILKNSNTPIDHQKRTNDTFLQIRKERFEKEQQEYNQIKQQQQQRQDRHNQQRNTPGGSTKRGANSGANNINNNNQNNNNNNTPQQNQRNLNQQNNPNNAHNTPTKQQTHINRLHARLHEMDGSTTYDPTVYSLPTIDNESVLEFHRLHQSEVPELSYDESIGSLSSGAYTDGDLSSEEDGCDDEPGELRAVRHDNTLSSIFDTTSTLLASSLSVNSNAGYLSDGDVSLVEEIAGYDFDEVDDFDHRSRNGNGEDEYLDLELLPTNPETIENDQLELLHEQRKKQYQMWQEQQHQLKQQQQLQQQLQQNAQKCTKSTTKWGVTSFNK
eukprot:UN03396